MDVNYLNNHNADWYEKIQHVKKAATNEFIHGGHLLGINAAFIGLATMIIFDLSFRWEIFVLLYLLTQAVYGFDHYYDLKNDSSNNNSRVEYVKRKKGVYPYRVALFSVLFLIFLFYYGTILATVVGISILFLGISYSLWFKKGTKKIVGFKNIYVASTVALAIVFTTFFFHANIPQEIMFFVIYAATSYFMNCSFCDIKDMDTDKKQGLRTLPLVLGKQRFFMFLIIINSLSLILLGFLVIIHFLPVYFISLVGFNILWFIVIHMGMKPDVDYHRFSGRILDSLEIFSFLILFMGKTLVTFIIL